MFERPTFHYRPAAMLQTLRDLQPIIAQFPQHVSLICRHDGLIEHVELHHIPGPFLFVRWDLDSHVVGTIIVWPGDHLDMTLDFTYDDRIPIALLHQVSRSFVQSCTQ